MKEKLGKIIEYGLYLFVFLLPWQTRWIWHEGFLAGGKWEYGSFSLYGTDILLILLLVLNLFQGSKIEKRARNILIIISGLIFISFLSIFGADQKEVAWYGFGRLFLGIILLWIVLRSKVDLKKIGISFVAAGFLQSVLAIYQFFSQSSFASKWLGMASQTPDVLGVTVVETASGRFLRAYGSLPHPNMLAGFLVVCLLILIALYFDLYRKIKKFLIVSENHAKTWQAIIGLFLVLVLVVVITFGLILTFSRSAWLAFIVSLIFIWIFYILKRRKDKLWLLLKITITFILVAIMSFSLFPELFKTRVVSQERLEIKSAQERTEYFVEARQLIRKHWLTGVGIGNYTWAVYNKLEANKKVWEYQPVHNIYLLIASEISIFGIIVFLILIFEFFKSIYIHRGKLIENNLFLIYSLIFVAFLIIGLFDHYFWSLSFGLWLFWLVLGLQVKSATED